MKLRPKQVPSDLAHQPDKAYHLAANARSTPLGHTERNRSLDGVRGVSVLMVLAYHHGLLNMGWIGVDAFFVLSGFLITSGLLQNRTHKFFYRTFWIKRLTRIAPPLVAVLCLVAMSPFAIGIRQMAGYLLTLGDVIAYANRESEVLRPLWSLAVEEHFYLLWPFAVRILSRKWMAILLAVLVVAEPALRYCASLYVHGWELVYFFTPFRLDGLGLGSLLALIGNTGWKAMFVKRWSGLGLCLTASVWVGFRLSLGNSFTREAASAAYNSCCYSLVAIAVFWSLAYLVTNPSSTVTRVLAWRPLALIGTISYGMYLYQEVIKLSVIHFLRITEKQALPIDLVLTVCISYGSYFLVESHLIRFGRNAVKSLEPNPRCAVLGPSSNI